MCEEKQHEFVALDLPLQSAWVSKTSRLTQGGSRQVPKITMYLKYILNISNISILCLGNLLLGKYLEIEMHLWFTIIRGFATIETSHYLVRRGRQRCVFFVMTRTLADLRYSLPPPSSVEQVHSPECGERRYFTVKMLHSEPS